MATVNDAILRAHRAALRVHGVSIVYVRGGAATAAFQALPGSTPTEQVISDEGATVRSRGKDFILQASLLVIDGQAVKPQDGDRITEGDVTWEVRPLGSEPSWRYSDPGRQLVRVHCLEVAS